MLHPKEDISIDGLLIHAIVGIMDNYGAAQSGITKIIRRLINSKQEKNIYILL
jgi:hypothetical protein